jgi:hypothetical protein
MNRKELTILGAITFCTVIAWIAFGVFHARRTTSVTDTQLKEIVPLTPTFDNDIIEKLKSREEF